MAYLNVKHMLMCGWECEGIFEGIRVLVCENTPLYHLQEQLITRVCVCVTDLFSIYMVSIAPSSHTLARFHPVILHANGV